MSSKSSLTAKEVLVKHLFSIKLTFTVKPLVFLDRGLLLFPWFPSPHYGVTCVEISRHQGKVKVWAGLTLLPVIPQLVAEVHSLTVNVRSYQNNVHVSLFKKANMFNL